jgi:GT2 family glycosyltransferase
LPEPLVTVVIPTLAADEALEECLRSLEAQTFRDFEVIVVDNSGQGLARRAAAAGSIRLIENRSNRGFGAAVNQGIQSSPSRYLATLNDDAVAQPGWLEALIEALEPRPEAGMCASKVRLAGQDLLDSAGMLIAPDGSSKQRGHRQPAHLFSKLEDVLLPSASAALYRRAMLDEIGGFDEDFFLYSEDTDLGLRARWAGWRCLYAPAAVVDHRYSHSAGRASPLKAYYVERNRLFVVVKNFPPANLVKTPFAALARYRWHLAGMRQGRGAAAEFRAEGNSAWRLVLFVLRAHLALLARLPRLWRQRRRIRRTARLRPAEFRRLLARHAISPREVAAL